MPDPRYGFKPRRASAHLDSVASAADAEPMPTVTFSGKGPLSRNRYIERAAAAGWVTWGKPAPGVDVLVIGIGHSATKAAAGRLNIAVVDYARWEEVMLTGEV